MRTGLMTLEERAVNGCTSCGTCYLRRMTERQAPHFRHEVLISLTDRRIVGNIVVINAEAVADSRCLLNERLYTAVSRFSTDPKHFRCEFQSPAEPASTVWGSGFVLIVTSTFGKYDTLLAEGYFIPHTVRWRPNQ